MESQGALVFKLSAVAGTGGLSRRVDFFQRRCVVIARGGPPNSPVAQAERSVGDRRRRGKVRHGVLTMVRKRVHARPLGCEYLNDRDACATAQRDRRRAGATRCWRDPRRLAGSNTGPILPLTPTARTSLQSHLSSKRRTSLIPYGNEPEGLWVSQPAGDVGMGLSGTQILNRRAGRGNRCESPVVGPVELVGERRESVGEAVGNASALSTGLSTRPVGLAPVRRTRPQIHTTAPLPWRAEPPDSPRCSIAFMPPSSHGARFRETVGRGPR